MPRLLPLLFALACGAHETDTDLDTDGDTDTDSAVDMDRDGSPVGEDCDDNDPDRTPGAPERCDGVDNNCDGEVRFEGDGGEECAPCEAGGYFDVAAAFTSPADLAARLALATDTVSCEYLPSTIHMFTQLDKVDGLVEGVYTGVKVAVGDVKPDADIMNTEHTWPRSLGTEEGEARCDLHHLFPTDSKANSRRGNYPFGWVTGAVDWQAGGSKLGADSDGSQVFEPRDAHKGNAARANLYIATRYGLEIDEAYEAVLRRMSDADPVDDAEQDRSLRILDFQGNSNPFVVCPFLVDEMDW